MRRKNKRVTEAVSVLVLQRLDESTLCDELGRFLRKMDQRATTRNDCERECTANGH